MVSINYENKEKEFRDYYNKNAGSLETTANSLENLVLALLETEISLQSVTSRVKDIDGCIEKFKRKYRGSLEDNKEEYEIKDYLTDLVGLRVVCLYETDIIEIKKTLENNFEVIEITDKIALMDNTDDQFGYKGLHLDLKLNGNRETLPEYQKLCNLKFELQIRTIIQDAWSVLDHKIKYKKSIPAKLKRRINRLAALFEIADSEFLRLRKETNEFTDKVTSLKIDAKSEEKTLDVFYFLSVTKEYFPDYEFLDYKIDGFVQEITEYSDKIFVNKFKDILEANMQTIKKYREFQNENSGNNLNPYTMIRHNLFLSDKESYKYILFEPQRNNFEKWLLDNA